MASETQNPISTDSAETLRDLVGDDPTATFEDDPTFVDSNPTGGASSENLGAAADVDESDDDVEDEDELDDEEGEDEDDLVDDDDEDDDEDADDEDIDDEEDEDDEDDDEDEAEEAGAEPALRLDGAGSVGSEADDDGGDGGRELAVDEDALNAVEEDDLALTGETS